MEKRPSRTGENPAPEDTFLVRICKALDCPPRMLAARIGVSFEEIEPLLDHRHLLVDLDRDETWWLIGEFVKRRLGLIMAASLELDRALEKDRAKRVTRNALMRERERKPAPERKA